MRLLVRGLCRIPRLLAASGFLAAASTGWSADPPADKEKAVVTIEVRMVQAPRAAVNALFSSTAYLVDAQQQARIQEWVDQKKAKIIAQPRITTISGQSAQLRAVREFIYPTEYEPPQVGDHVSSPPIPGGFKTRELGVLLNVTPTIGADLQWVAITLIPEQSKLSAREVVKYKTNLRGVGQTDVTQPDIGSLNLTTQVVLKSGSTVLLGVYDPWEDGRRESQDQVILALLSAAVHGPQ